MVFFTYCSHYALSQIQRHNHKRLDITTLPKDYILLICDHLDLPDISSLHRTCSVLAIQGELMNSDKSSPIIPTASILIHFDRVRGLDRAMSWAFIHKGDADFARHLLRRGYKMDNIESRLPPIRLRHPIIECVCDYYPTHRCGLNTVAHQYEVASSLVIHAVHNGRVELLRLLDEEQRQLPKTIPLVLHIERGITVDELSVFLEEGSLPDGSYPETSKLRFFETLTGPPPFQAPIEAAAYYGRIDLLRALLERGAGFEYATFRSRESICFYAFIAYYLFALPNRLLERAIEVTSTCVEYGLNVNQGYWRIFRYASRIEPAVTPKYSYLLKDAFIMRAKPHAGSKAIVLVASLIFDHGAWR
ncbi:hypothetical protein CcaCcLH18_08993 [Colletotrichum camelliae]|nr:hypothetical protein CcaCcLH18_08993 [Colletotrichum camelliae]